MEEKIYTANKMSLDVHKQLKDSQKEIDQLKQYIYDLKTRMNVYIPVKDDLVDKKLADFINNNPERQKLNLMFTRDGSGIYRYGQKRICMKVEKNGSIKVRVGGGYLSLNEFVDQHAPIVDGRQILRPQSAFNFGTRKLSEGRNRQSSPNNR